MISLKSEEREVRLRNKKREDKTWDDENERPSQAKDGIFDHSPVSILCCGRHEATSVGAVQQVHMRCSATQKIWCAEVLLLIPTYVERFGCYEPGTRRWLFQ